MISSCEDLSQRKTCLLAVPYRICEADVSHLFAHVPALWRCIQEYSARQQSSNNKYLNEQSNHSSTISRALTEFSRPRAPVSRLVILRTLRLKAQAPRQSLYSCVLINPPHPLTHLYLHLLCTRPASAVWKRLVLLPNLRNF